MSTTDKNAALQKWLALQKKKATSTTIAAKPIDATTPLSHGQERLWLLQQLYPKSSLYSYAHLYHFKGNLDIERLLKNFQKIAERHQILRTNYSQADEKLVQVLSKNHKIPVISYDLSELASEEKIQQKAEIIQESISQSFNLEGDVLLRLAVIKISTTEHLLILTMHHILGDRGSLQILNQELAQLYQGKTLEPLAIQYADYAYWQRQQNTKENDLNYWKKQLAGELPILTLPGDFPRPSSTSFQGAMQSKKLEETLSQQLKAICKQENTTLFVLGLAAFKVLLHRYTGEENILVGAPFSNRDKVSLEQLIGFFNETLVLRSDLSNDLTFLDLVQQLKQTTLDAFAHKNVPFDTLVRELQPERQGTSNPLFQVMFVFNASDQKLSFGEGIELGEEMLDLGVSKFDLTLFLSDEGDQIKTTFEYSTDLFEQDSLERMLGHFEVLLKDIAQYPSKKIGQLNLLSKGEQQQILVDWNLTSTPLPDASSVLQLFDKQSLESPNKIAVTSQNKQITYQELQSKAKTIAHFLQQQNVQPNQLVGLLTRPSLEMIIGILGILKAGAAYLPLDAEYPKERLEYMLDDAQVEIVLEQRELQHHLAETNTQVFDIQTIVNIQTGKKNKELPTPKPTDLAYMIYTSGSTGKPKGVPISHYNLLHSTAARFNFYEQQPAAFLLLSSFSFDSSVAGIFWTICSGGKLVLAPKRIEQDINKLSKIIDKQQVTHSLMLPSLYQLLLEYAPKNQLQSLQTIMVAGEACFPKVVQQHFARLPQTLLYNEYGPTEGTVWSTAHRITHEDTQNVVPIGRPIPNMQNYILDKNLQTVPIGVAGELYISGKGIAHGYWQRPELTAKRFLENPFGEGKLYKTGDLARYQKDGTIEFLGRTDQQIKIRGHRVELEEIKAILLQHLMVKDAVISVQKEQLVAYITPQEKLVISTLKQDLKARLPEYMIPSVFVEMDTFPTLPNGKINHRALPTTQEYRKEKAASTPPETEVEKQLASIWQAVLKVDVVHLEDNFFEIGGDSIRSIQAIAKAQKAGLKLAPNHLFEYQNLRELAQFLEKPKCATNNWSNVATINKGSNRTPLFCIHSGAAHVLFYRNLSKYLDAQQPIYALQPKGLDGQSMQHDSIEAMAAFYLSEMKKVQPEGPYAILGTCFSNAVGLEMAHQLKAAGEELNLLLFVDSAPAHLLSSLVRGENKTAQRLGKMLKDRDWKSIRRKIRNRFIYLNRFLFTRFKNEQQKNLQSTVNSLNLLYKRYTWQAIEEKIVLIRSSEFSNLPEKDYHVHQWQKLAGKGLEVHVVEGHHLTLFEEPEVKGLAEKIRGFL
ncbi:MAG: amino acid adenylation domain-containing protein [Bacteroidota bacterium]